SLTTREYVNGRESLSNLSPILQMLLSLLLSSLLVAASADFDVKVEYSVDDWATVHTLGKVSLQSIEGNFSGTFKAHSDAKQLGTLLAGKKNGLYQIRSVSSAHPTKHVYSSAKPCLILRSHLMHELFLSISPRTRSLLSATLFPDPLFLDKEEQCPEAVPSDSAHATVVVAAEAALPGPDTQSYLDKMTKEKAARQHGAESDNRSFLAKYWMYIVPVVIFVLVSNAVNPAEGEQ
ncbi:hypothetical protein PFISCL1PPCAC_23668, partial [Pristionchus fissidentatus]